MFREVVVKADAFDGVAADGLAVVLAQPNRTADAGVIRIIFRKRRRHDAFAHLGLDQHVRLAVMGIGARIGPT